MLLYDAALEKYLLFLKQCMLSRHSALISYRIVYNQYVLTRPVSLLRTMDVSASCMISNFLLELDNNCDLLCGRMLSRNVGKELPLLAIYCRLKLLTVREKTKVNILHFVDPASCNDSW